MEWTIRWWQISVRRVYPTATELSQAYNRAASGWHQHLGCLGYRDAYRKLWQSIDSADALPAWKDDISVCDCGVGTGALSIAFVQTINPTAHITGVDLSGEMLNQARDRFSQAEISHQLCQGDVNSLPFRDDAFDAFISAHMLEHLSNPARGLREMVRVLRPGAPLVLVVTRSGLLGTLIQWYWGNRCFNLKELSTLMQQAGLSRLQFFSFPLGLARLTSIACIGFKLEGFISNPLD